MWNQQNYLTCADQAHRLGYILSEPEKIGDLWAVTATSKDKIPSICCAENKSADRALYLCVQLLPTV